TRNPNGAIEQCADLVTQRAIGLLKGGRIDAVFGAFAARIGRCVRTDTRPEFFKRRASERMDPPRLQIAAGRRAGGSIENVAHRRERHRRRQKRPTTESRGNSVTYIHGLSPQESGGVWASSRRPKRASIAIPRQLTLCVASG